MCMASSQGELRSRPPTLARGNEELPAVQVDRDRGPYTLESVATKLEEDRQ